ncbi:unnamed protein product [Sphenostylis stenocarpa]|uniref:Uncharacterized protein n=1 Tax=Sphenostylis stenocarpa TaxID=92480 RepID=A0AA86VIZ7_9FABA|nr:unnamed protein product [Sphenostylis stenocarpa]
MTWCIGFLFSFFYFLVLNFHDLQWGREGEYRIRLWQGGYGDANQRIDYVFKVVLIGDSEKFSKQRRCDTNATHLFVPSLHNASSRPPLVAVSGGAGRDCIRFLREALWRHGGVVVLMAEAVVVHWNLEGDLQTGAIAGYSLLWLLMWAMTMVT